MESALRKHLEDMRKVVRDAAGYVRASAAMVDLIVQYSGNDVLVTYVRDFALRIGRYTRLGLATLPRRRASFQAWENVVAAVAARDGRRAGELHSDLALANREAAIAEFRRLQEAGANG
jgi:DNA-binding GntR family transcriptional regulator